MNLENATCPVCSSEGSPVFTQQDLFCSLPGDFGQRNCDGCGTFFLSPRVPEADIGPYYPDAYAPYQAQNPSKLLLWVANLFGLPQRKRRIVEQFITQGKILDVGCGSGELLQSFEDDRWQKFALDLDCHLRPGLAVEFHRGRFDHDRLPLVDLDVVTLWHVFEHLYNPRAALAHASALLKKGGYLFIAIPDLKCLERKFFGRYWVGWDPPRHVATYSRAGISTLLEEAGFRLVDVVPDSCTADLVALNLEFALRSRGWKLNLHRSVPLRLLFAPLTFVVKRLGLAPAKVYVAQQ